MTKRTPAPHTAIAVVGVSALFPGSANAGCFWNDILAGKDLLSDVPASHWLVEDYYDPDPAAPDKTYAKRGGFLGPVDFDPMSWGVPPNILEATDTSQLLALIVAEQVLRDATAEQFETMDRSRMSVILGVTSAQELLGTMVSRLQRPIWAKALRDHGLSEEDVEAVCTRISNQYVPWQESSFPGLLGNVVAGRIANRLDLGGTNCVTDAACASTFSALSMAVHELYRGDSDLVITGGVDTLNDIFMFLCFSKTPALSLTGDCRPFSDQADGTMLGEGLGMVALKRLERAEQDGDRIYAVITGVGASSDGHSKSVYAPVPEGQAKALRRAYNHAGYEPQTVELIEAHGTGTKAGDAAEFEGLRQVFTVQDESRPQWCALGSVKSQIGHTKAAAGAAGLFKAVMALHHKVLPPTIKVEQPNPKLALEDSAFYLNTNARPWIRTSDHPRRAGVSSFGFGGSNFHVSLEEYQGPAARPPRLRTLPVELITLCAPDGAALAEQAAALAARCQGPEMFRRIAWESAHRHAPGAEARLAVVASSTEDLHQKLLGMAEIIAREPRSPFTLPDGSVHGVGPQREGGVAFIFSGQGSQYVGMGAELAMAFDAARRPWDQAADVALDHWRRLDQVVFPIPRFNEQQRQGDDALLRATEWAQPAIGATSMSQLAMLDALGIQSEAVAGHSFGEVTALYAAGLLSAEDFLGVARKRGALMAAASELPGGMIAITATMEQVQALLDELKRSDLVVANHNAPRQVVISGALDAIEAAEELIRQRGLTGKRLPVATAFHSPVVAGSEAPFGRFLAEVPLGESRRTVWSGESAAPYEASADEVRACLSRQIANPVRFVDLIQNMADSGIQTFIEVGPSAVLTGLVGQILDGREHLALALDRRGNNGVQTLLRGVAQLIGEGQSLNLEALWQGYAEPEDTHARQPPKLAVRLTGANHNKRYPARDGASPVSQATAAAERTVGAPAGPAAMPVDQPPVGRQPVDRQPVDGPTVERPPVGRQPMPDVQSAQQARGASSVSLPDGWLAAWQEAQRQNGMAHAALQQASAQSYTAYLRSMDASMATLASVAGLTCPSSDAGATDHPGLAAQPGASPMPPMMQQPLMQQPLMQQPMMPPPPMPSTGAAAVESTLQLVAMAPDPLPMADHPGPVQAAAPANVDPALDLEGLMLAVVSDKTGYPGEMLNLSMDMESDLGIDSIKRVEILSAVEERAPGMPEVDASHMGTLKTLGEIVEYMQGLLARGGATARARSAGDLVAPSVAESMAADPAQDLGQVMFSVVSDKTGYPSEMLNLDMDMESDLGIDSIKRVEILSAVQERAPGLPDVDASHMGTLKTLGHIVEYMQSLLEQPAAGAAQWTDAVAAMKTLETADAPRVEASLGRYLLELVDCPAAGFAQPGLLGGGEVCVTGEEGGLAQALAAELGRRGINARVVGEVQASARAVIFLGGLRDVRTPEEAIEVEREALRIARTIAPRYTDEGGLLVTVQDTGGAFGTRPFSPERAFLAGLAALVKTAAQEWPTASLKAIDLERGGREDQALAAALADELLLGGGPIEVALDAAGRRTCPRSVAAKVTSGAGLMGPKDVIVVSGGARGVTSACVKQWARENGGRFILLGRTPLEDEPCCCAGNHSDADLKRALLAAAQEHGEQLTPSTLSRKVRRVLAGREIRATMAELQAVGAEACYHAVDVTDAEAVRAALEQCRSVWGPITGVVHGAGLIADQLIAVQTDAQFDSVFDTKVEGLRLLLAALEPDPLKLVCLFSSVSARCGNNGQAAYAMANEVLNKIAWVEARTRGGQILVKSLGWGPWEGGMVSPQLQARFAQLGVPMIPLAAGAKMFVDEMKDASAQQVELVLGGEPNPEALLSVGSQARKLTLELQVNHRTHSYLSGHCIDGEVVVPVALVAEWFSRLARIIRPNLHAESIRKIQVLKGIQIQGFEAEGERLMLSGHKLSNGQGVLLGLELRGSSGTLHYRAEAQMAAEHNSAARQLTPELVLDAWSGAPIYGDVLFHQRDFQVIQTLDGAGGDGISGTLKGVARADWRWERWETDVAAMDGGLQLLLLWAREQLGGAALPTSIGELRMLTRPPAAGSVRCVAHCRKSGSHGVLADVAFQDEGGVRFAELNDVELTLRPMNSVVQA